MHIMKNTFRRCNEWLSLENTQHRKLLLLQTLNPGKLWQGHKELQAHIFSSMTVILQVAHISPSKGKEMVFLECRNHEF